MQRKTRELSDRKQNLSRSEFQFSVSSIFILTFLVAVAIVFLRELSLRFGPAASAVVILAVLSILAHVAGAVIGGRLRAKDHITTTPNDANPDETNDPNQQSLETQKHVQPLEAKATDFAPPTELSHQKPLERRPIFYGVGIGAGFGAAVASIILTWYMWDDLQVINVVFGAVCSAVIGGFFGYLFSSLYQVVRSAFSEAQKDARF